MKTLLLLLATLGLAVATPSTSVADALFATPIKKLPATIKKPGVYRLAKDLTYTKTQGAAITIDADGVTLDLAGRQLSTIQDGTSNTIAVSGTDRQNVTICNGRIIGFDVGVRLDGDTSSRGHCVRDLVVQDCGTGGIFLEGSGCVVQNNRLESIGSLQEGSPRPTYGVWIEGNYGLVQGNRIANIYNSNPSGTAYPVYGVRISGQAGIVCENSISSISNLNSSPAIATIVDGTSNTIAIVEDNRVNGVKSGIHFEGDATGVYRNNTVYGASADPYMGGTAQNGGGNY